MISGLILFRISGILWGPFSQVQQHSWTCRGSLAVTWWLWVASTIVPLQNAKRHCGLMTTQSYFPSKQHDDKFLYFKGSKKTLPEKCCEIQEKTLLQYLAIAYFRSSRPRNQHKYLNLKYVWPVELHPSVKREGPLTLGQRTGGGAIDWMRMSWWIYSWHGFSFQCLGWFQSLDL